MIDRSIFIDALLHRLDYRMCILFTDILIVDDCAVFDDCIFNVLLFIAQTLVLMIFMLRSSFVHACNALCIECCIECGSVIV